MGDQLIPAVEEGNAPESSGKILERIRSCLGWVPDVFGVAAHSPAVLESCWHQAEAGVRMKLSRRLREAVAVRVAELNGSRHRVPPQAAAHWISGTCDEEIKEFRAGRSNVAKEQAILALVTKVIKNQGHHAGFVVQAARQLGVSDEEIVEVITLITFHTWMAYISGVANSELDLPAVIGEREMKAEQMKAEMEN